MARLNVNPTRMELLKLKQKLSTARRGHKLLKDKSDEMIRQFMVYIKQNRELRQAVEKDINETLKDYMFACSKMTGQEVEKAVSIPSTNYDFIAGFTNIMGLSVPKIKIKEVKSGELLPYSLVSNSSKLDKSIITLSGLLEKIILLAEVEKTCTMLAEDIEKNRRRINALEYVLIPNTLETIKYIVMKLEENERNNKIRLMKVKKNYNENN